jgi:hypothetical protein
MMGGVSPRAVIFAGPSLPPALRPSDPALEWFPPVRQGGVYQAALTRPVIIGIIDGYFEVTPTVWHKEILWAMTQGIHVYGSASIGALRAAELAPFGMKGVGQIYEAFRDGILEDDDEVAVLHGPEELGYPAVTEAMINIRATLAAATNCGVIGSSLATSLTAIAKSKFYKDRTYSTILHAAAARGLKRGSLKDLAEWLRQSRIDLKYRDARAMVNAISDHLVVGISPLRVSYALAHTVAWEAVRQQAGVRFTVDLPTQAIR